ncbi:MAG: hypothetical protein WB784_01710 [Rhodanobacteraceae bacterium]
MTRRDRDLIYMNIEDLDQVKAGRVQLAVGVNALCAYHGFPRSRCERRDGVPCIAAMPWPLVMDETSAGR